MKKLFSCEFSYEYSLLCVQLCIDTYTHTKSNNLCCLVMFSSFFRYGEKYLMLSLAMFNRSAEPNDLKIGLKMGN